MQALKNKLNNPSASISAINAHAISSYLGYGNTDHYRFCSHPGELLDELRFLINSLNPNQIYYINNLVNG